MVYSSPNRTLLEKYKNALANANNNLNFLLPPDPMPKFTF
jgi:hypothetical protein